jgi:RimJ/RimL family protein N-acetyltransferase
MEDEAIEFTDRYDREFVVELPDKYELRDYDKRKGVQAGAFEIRRATRADLPRINRVYDIARNFMEQGGNPLQWSGGYPWPDLLDRDIEQKQLFVLSADGVIRGVFAFILGVDPTYVEIEGGAWLNGEPYGTIHRIASDGQRPGVFKACLEFCLERTANIRIDTHADNTHMQAVLAKNGFIQCGVIYVRDGVSDRSPRLAYQYI